MRSERSAFELVNSDIVELESQELHASVVTSVLRISRVVPAGMKLREPISRHCGRSVTEISLMPSLTPARPHRRRSSRLGCAGKNLGPLISDARTMGLLGLHDSKLVASTENLMKWVSADRCQSGTGTTVLQPGFAELPGCPDRLGGVAPDDRGTLPKGAVVP